MSKRRYASVSELVRAVADDESFVEEFEQHISERSIITSLVSSRAAMGLSQTDVAKAMGCTQGRISKFENGVDNDLRLGDLAAYAKALGLDLCLATRPSVTTATEELNYHASEITRISETIRRFGGKPPKARSLPKSKSKKTRKSRHPQIRVGRIALLKPEKITKNT